MEFLIRFKGTNQTVANKFQSIQFLEWNFMGFRYNINFTTTRKVTIFKKKYTKKRWKYSFGIEMNFNVNFTVNLLFMYGKPLPYIVCTLYNLRIMFVVFLCIYQRHLYENKVRGMKEKENNMRYCSDI